MRYQCDSCGCYLDPGEGRICDECQEKAQKREKEARRLAGRIYETEGQYTLKFEEDRYAGINI